MICLFQAILKLELLEEKPLPCVRLVKFSQCFRKVFFFQGVIIHFLMFQ